MIKLLAMLKRKEGMSREEFKAYYDNIHAGKNLAVLTGVAAAYRRNYVVKSFDAWGEGFDVVTEVVFDTIEDAYKVLEALEDPKNAFIEEDEYNLFDRSAHRYVLVETSETDPALLSE